MSLYRRRPRPLAQTLTTIENEWVPDSTLARIQRIWPRIAGAEIAAVAAVVSERGGLVTIHCELAAWTTELDLMAPELIAKINSQLGQSEVKQLRCITAAK